jgi:hypothetical protein
MFAHLRNGHSKSSQPGLAFVLRFPVVLLCIVTVLHPRASQGQTSSATPQPQVGSHKKKIEASTNHLEPVQTTVIPSEAGYFAGSLACDNDGKLYFQSDYAGGAGIRKFNAKGERLAFFQVSTIPDFQKVDGAGSFALGQDGELYYVVFPHEITRYVAVFKSDGSYKSTIKLQPGFAWLPGTLAVFPSGNLLISGQRYRREQDKIVSLPFTGIFSTDGTLLKEVKLEDDEALHDMAVNGDARVTSPTNPSANHAVDFSKMQPAGDGNIYLMRWVSPAILYGISPGGEVIRRFTVDPGDANLMPAGMHISGNSIAIVFFQHETKQDRIKVVDLEGHETASYDEHGVEGKSKIPMLLFACFTENPQRFTFLSTGEDDKLELLVAEPR